MITTKEKGAADVSKVAYSQQENQQHIAAWKKGSSIEEVSRHFGIAVYVVSPQHSCFALLHRPLKDGWSPVQGHMNTNEPPEVAAVRLVREKLGLQIQLLGRRFPRGHDYLSPFGIERVVLGHGGHEHMSMVYLGIPAAMEETPPKLVPENARWFSLDDMNCGEIKICETSPLWAKAFLDLFKKSEVTP